MKNRRALLITAIILAVIILVAVASYLMSSKDTEASPDNTPTPAPSQISEYGFPVSHIKAGEGGNTTAADGTTRIGYNHSCDDAVRAAVNYSSADSYSPNTWEENKQTLETLLVPNEQGAEYIDALESMATGGATSQKSLFQPSLYLVQDCESGKSASIAVVQRVHSDSFKIDGRAVPATTEIRVTDQRLVWQDGDWKLDQSSQNATFRPESQLLYTEEKQEPSNPREILDRLFTDSTGNPLSREGWLELS